MDPAQQPTPQQTQAAMGEAPMLAPGAAAPPLGLPPGMLLPGMIRPPAPGSMPGLPGMLPPMMQSPMMQYPLPMLNDLTLLSQFTGIPLKQMRDNPAMAVAAQQLFTQRMLQQQLLSTQLARPGMMHPNMMQQFHFQQQAQAQQAQAAASAAKAPSTAKPRGRKKATTPKQPVHPAPPRDPSLREDPGGSLIWAKVANYPWWPAKTLDPEKDYSFPPEAEPPRPTAIPARLFGTHEFVWIGSKRAMEEWGEGQAKGYGAGSAEAAFTAAVDEAETYRADKKLPEAFFLVPVSDGVKRGKVRRRGSTAGTAAGGASSRRPGEVGDGLGTPSVGAVRPRPARAPGPPAEDRAAVVYSRKRQRLLDLGLLPPDDSPYVRGRVAPNPALLALKPAWQAECPEVMVQAEVAAAVRLDAPRASLPPPTKAVLPAAAPAPVVLQSGPAAVPLPTAPAFFAMHAPFSF